MWNLILGKKTFGVRCNIKKFQKWRYVIGKWKQKEYLKNAGVLCNNGKGFAKRIEKLCNYAVGLGFGSLLVT